MDLANNLLFRVLFCVFDGKVAHRCVIRYANVGVFVGMEGMGDFVYFGYLHHVLLRMIYLLKSVGFQPIIAPTAVCY